MSIRYQPLARGAALLAACALLSHTTPAQVTLRSNLIQSGLDEPLFLTSPPGDTNRLFVVQHGGVIVIIENGVLLPTPFLDLSPIISGGSGSDERGLLGLAFHPEYARNGKFYVDYTDVNSNEVLREYLVSSNPDVADPTSFTTLFGPYTDPQSNHNGGCLQFGPDGKLYYSLGDGGSADDTGLGHDPATGNAQSLHTYFGKMLRFDVDNPPTYVPSGNPYPGPDIPLAWSIGLRNPWRFSFDRATGDMYIGDVGQGAAEEIDFQPASSHGGENYGWRCMEGDLCTGLTGCTCNAANLRMPVQTYDHFQGCAVIGGCMYRGPAIPTFQGNYVYGDYCSGRIWSFQFDGSTVTNFVDRTAELAPGGPHFIDNPTSFGEDANGEIYICDFGGGEIYRIEAICPLPTNYCVAAPNSTGFGTTMSFVGSGSIPENNLQLFAFGNPPNVNGIFYYGQGTAQVPVYNGFRCIGSNFHRLPIVQSNSFGDAQWSFDVHAPPAVILPGSTWNFQFFYRDPGVGAGANYSDALSVPFCLY
jgi:glucose/arabinose dehydrogenase